MRLAARDDPVNVANQKSSGAHDVDAELEIAIDSLLRECRIGAEKAAPHADSAAANRKAGARAQRRLAVDSHDARADADADVVDRAHELRHRPVCRLDSAESRGCKHGAYQEETGEFRPPGEQNGAKKCLLQTHPARIIIDLRLR